MYLSVRKAIRCMYRQRTWSRTQDKPEELKERKRLNFYVEDKKDVDHKTQKKERDPIQTLHLPTKGSNTSQARNLKIVKETRQIGYELLCMPSLRHFPKQVKTQL